MEKIVVTAALPYANGSIHIGHLVEYIQADIFVRYLKLKGEDAIYCCADDTHGTPIEIKSQNLGITPEELIDKYHKEHLEDFSCFHIDFDSYYTTNAPENKELADLVFSRAQEKGYIYTKRVELTYCDHCGRFLPDRYVRGTCPKCGETDQYGDHCESCQTTYSTTDLKSPKCAQCQNPPSRRESDHYFFKVSAFTEELRAWFRNTPSLQSEVKNYLENWMKDGLKDWDITRDAPYFGFKILGEEDKYYYVWLDAPIGYIASTKHYCAERGLDFEDYWTRPGSRIVHFIGKDIIYFHFLFWPAMLMAADFNLPSDIVVHGFLTVKGLKMSKSRGSFITAREYLDRGGDPTYLRFYFASGLARNLNNIDLETDDFTNRINSVLIGNVANFVNRSLSFLKKNFDGVVTGTGDEGLEEQIAPRRTATLEAYERVNYRDAIKTIMEVSDLGNRFIQSQEPWKKLKDDRETAHRIVSAGVHVVRDLAVMLKPVVPAFSEEVEKQLGLSDLTFRDLGAALDGHRISSASPILKRIEKLEIFRSDPFDLLDIRVARIETVEEHPNADRLWVLKIDAGTETRQLVAGLRSVYAKEDLEGKKVLFLRNLKPAKLRGVESRGMVLAAVSGDEAGVILATAAPGTRLLREGQEDVPAHIIDYSTFSSVTLESDGEKVLYSGEPLKVENEPVRVDGGVRGNVQ